MKSATVALSALVWVSGMGLAWGAPGPQAACEALAEQTREAVALKKQGLAVDQAVARLSTQAPPDSVPAAQHDFYKGKLSGATRFAYMAGMSGEGAAAFYLKQCLQGS